jgi:hypothetical protein
MPLGGSLIVREDRYGRSNDLEQIVFDVLLLAGLGKTLPAKEQLMPNHRRGCKLFPVLPEHAEHIGIR